MCLPSHQVTDLAAIKNSRPVRKVARFLRDLPDKVHTTQREHEVVGGAFIFLDEKNNHNSQITQNTQHHENYHEQCDWKHPSPQCQIHPQHSVVHVLILHFLRAVTQIRRKLPKSVQGWVPRLRFCVHVDSAPGFCPVGFSQRKCRSTKLNCCCALASLELWLQRSCLLSKFESKIAGFHARGDKPHVFGAPMTRDRHVHSHCVAPDTYATTFCWTWGFVPARKLLYFKCHEMFCGFFCLNSSKELCWRRLSFCAFFFSANTDFSFELPIGCWTGAPARCVTLG